MHLFPDILDIGVSSPGALTILNWAIYLHVIALFLCFCFLVKRAFSDEAKAKAAEEREMEFRGEGKKR